MSGRGRPRPTGLCLNQAPLSNCGISATAGDLPLTACHKGPTDVVRRKGSALRVAQDATDSSQEVPSSALSGCHT
jgi:hypothetical protein